MALIKPLPANGGGDPAYTNVYGHRRVQYDAKRAVIIPGSDHPEDWQILTGLEAEGLRAELKGVRE
jgi:hypothetical protein